MTPREGTPAVTERERVLAGAAVMPVTHLVWRPAVAIVEGRLVAVRQSVPTPAARR